MTARLRTAAALLGLWSAAALAQQGDPTPFCGNEGVWIQILGAGGPELDDRQASASYLLFIDNRSRLLVDTGPGAAAAFDRAGGRFADLDAIVFTHLHADHTADFPAFVDGSAFADRDRPLPVLGPTGDGPYPDTVTFVERLIGADGAYPYLAEFLTFRSRGGYKLSPRSIPAVGRERHGGLGSENFQLAAIPVHHGGVPALAWRVDIGDQSVVFTGDFNDQKNVIASFAKGADALVIHHSVPDNARGTLADLYVTPSQIGRIAAAADVRMVILGHRMNRTRGLESLTRQAIEQHYDGSLIFANDLECWGL
ncbi:MAG TPA: MBL fold metallo-hydrolase [Pseudomonadales bacterium]